MKINLNIKKKQKTFKKSITKNSVYYNNLNTNLYYNNNNNLKFQSHLPNNLNTSKSLVYSNKKWSRCNFNNLKFLKKGCIDNKRDTNSFLNHLAMIERQIKQKTMVKSEFGFLKKNICQSEEKCFPENLIKNNLNGGLQKDFQGYEKNGNDEQEKENLEMEKEKKLKDEEHRKEKIKEENIKKLKQCYNNTPYPMLLNENDENGFYDNTFMNSSNLNPNHDGKRNNYHNENENNYNNLLHNIKSTVNKDISFNSYVNQIPNEVLIKVFNNSMFSQNDYYKFCLVCKSWNQAATIVLWNKPYIYSFSQLIKFNKCLIYNEKILKKIKELSETKTEPIIHINHNLSGLVNKLDLTRVRLERPISTHQRTELYKALNILGDKLMPYLNSLFVCREQCNSYLFLESSIVEANEDINNNNNNYNQIQIQSVNNMRNENDFYFKEITFPSVQNLRFIDLNYKSLTYLFKNLKKFNNIETLYISIALFQSWKEWNSNNRLNNYLIFQKVIDNIHSPSLKKIKFQNCCDLNDEACFNLFSKCSDISELEILGSSNVSIDVIYYSIKMLKNLKILSYTATSTPQFKLTEDSGDNGNIDREINEENRKEKNIKEGPMMIDLSNESKASQIQIIDINSSGWSPYLNWMFNNQSCQSLKKLILIIQTEDERDTIYKAVSSCSSLEELIITYRHESNNENGGDNLLINEQLTIDLDKLFLVETEEYQSNINFLHISGFEIEKSKRLTKHIESMRKEVKNKDNYKECKEKSKYLKFDKLKYLHLYLPSSKCPIEYILYQFPGLEEFVLNLSEPVEEEIIENEIIQNNAENQNNQNQANNEDDSTNNSTLNIDETLNSKPMIEVDKFESKVKRLSIRSSSFGDGFSDKQISSIIKKCSSITNLELDCKSLTEGCLCQCVEFLKGNLISLRLERVNRSTITDRFLDCLCQYNPLIQQLEIFAEHGKLDVTNNGTNNIIEKCKNLKYFSLGLEGFNPIVPYYLEQSSNYRSYFRNLNYKSKKKYI
ncbi:hypothetical protein BCR36DRAFT_333204 [Piromyces finnis]|uniref:F-box domain-containing protein n=1 Tax=Piromyces finnis TaxID=1754191 RepID=A0A1Y1V1S9_9FUNG|nr:hypothetical protein BCR36DRAFT_333204 [Piromyces finnis]|eukprot:ORX45392.1 hypothetical protein BCR36DRAFT_333204 [Piromyces finnis]